MSTLFTVVVKLVVPASDFNPNVSGAMEDRVSAILTQNLQHGDIIKDWGFIKNADGTFPLPVLLDIDSDDYKEGDAFREEKVPTTHEKPVVMDFIKRWLPEEEQQRLHNFEELQRIERLMISDEKDANGKYVDDAYRLWVEEFDQDLTVLSYEIKNAAYLMMQRAITNYLEQTQS